MWLLWFLLGLALGLSFLAGYLLLMGFRVRSALKKYSGDAIELPLGALVALAVSPKHYKGYSRLQENKHKKVEQELATWQNIIQNMPTGYLQVDEENRLFWCNQVAASLLGIADYPEKVKAKRLLLQLVRSYELDRLIEKTRAVQTSLQQEWVFHRVFPDPLYPLPSQDTAMRGSSIALADGHVGIFIEDCQEAVNLAQQRDRWASDVAHELKTPLTSIRLIAETLQELIDPKLRVWIDRLLNEIIRLSNLVQDLLDLSQLEPGMGRKLKIVDTDVYELIYAAWDSLEPLAAKRDIKLVYEGLPSILIQADQSRLHRLLLNILDNSIKHSPSSQSVLVKTTCLDSQIQIEIIDCGSGLPEEALPHVFERFYRVDSSRARLEEDRGGSGLGLAIAYQIVQAHQGTIKMSNHPETNGAWVIITLPFTASFK